MPLYTLGKRSCLAGVLLLLTGTSTLVAQEKIIPVSVTAVAMAPVFDEIPLTGSVTARRVSRISPKVEGFVEEMLVDEGDRVDAREPLARLDPLMASINLDRAQAQLEEARANLNEAMRQREEARELLKQKHISPTNFESRQAEVNIRSAALDRLQAELEQQREFLKRHVVYAPFEGVIARKQVEVGQWVETSTTLFELVEISVLRIIVPVPQIYFGRVREGTPASVRFDAFPERRFESEISMKIPAGSASTRTFPVRIEMQNDNGLIAPGMSARVRLRLTEAGEAKLIPRDAIVRKPDGSETVWVLNGNSGEEVVHALKVRTARARGDNIEILSDELVPGDRVVVRGNEILQERQRVQVVSERSLVL